MATYKTISNRKFIPAYSYTNLIKNKRIRFDIVLTWQSCLLSVLLLELSGSLSLVNLS